MLHTRIPLEPTCSRESASREHIELICEIRQGVGAWKRVRLSDLSPSGFRIAWLPDVRTSEPLRIRIPGMQLLVAHIRWRHGNQLGCEFASPLHVAVFDHLIDIARRNG